MSQIAINVPETGERILLNLPGDRKKPTPEEAQRALAAFRSQKQQAPPKAAPPARGASSEDPSLLRQMFSARAIDTALVGGLGTAGMIAGGAAGLPGGPGGVAGGGLAGGALGTAGGRALSDALLGEGRRLGIVGSEGPILDDPRLAGAEGGPLGIAQRAATEGAVDLALPGALGAVGRGAKRSFKAIARTTGDASQRIQLYAQHLGVPLGVENVSDTRALRAARETIGKFPFFNKPFRELDVAQGEGLIRAQERLLSDLAPVASTITDTGADLSRRVIRRTKAVRRIFNRRYDDLLSRATDEGALIPTATVKQVARDIVDTFSGELPTKTGGKAIDPRKAGVDTSLIDFAKSELSNLSDTMTPRQFKRFQTVLNDLIQGQETLQNKGRAVSLRKALEDDFEEIIGSPDLVRELRDTNRAFRDWAQLLQRPTAQRFQRVDRGVFSFGGARPGTRNEDELFRMVMNTKSPDAIADLGRLVGPRGMRSAARLQLEEAFRNTFDESTRIADLNKARQALGIGRPRSAERAAFGRLLKETKTGQSIADWERFFDVSEAALSQSPVNVSQFIARRATLGGSRALVRGLNPANLFANPAGAAAGGAGAGFLLGSSTTGLAIGIAAAFATRRALGLLTTPGALRVATEAIDPSRSPALRTQAVARLTRLIGQEGMREIESGVERAAEEWARRMSEMREDQPAEPGGRGR